jgi:type IV secretory pathway VirB9-like protein
MPRVVAIAGLCLTLMTPSAWAVSQKDQPRAEDISGPSSRRVRYDDNAVVPLYAHVRFTTMIVLPRDERILDFVCGDKEFWIVNGNENLAYIKPAKTGAQTNLNLITASGNVYSFLLTEISEPRGRTTDLKVYIDLTESSMVASSDGKPTFVAAQQLEDYRQQIELAKQEARTAAKQADDRVAAYQAAYPLNLRFGYRFRADQKPFLVTAIYHDDKFTFIQTKAAEPPTLYEVKDRKPSLVEYTFRNGVYVVGKVLDTGYLAIGAKRLPFSRAE